MKKIIMMLITSSASVNIMPSMTLVDAARNGELSLVRRLLAGGANVNEASADAHDYGATSLYVAAYDGYEAVVGALLATPGIDVNKANIYGVSPLLAAVGRNYPAIVQMLFAAPGIDVNKARNEDGATPFSVAIEKDNFPIIQALLAAPGIDVNKTQNDGTTPLWRAAKTFPPSKVIKLLTVPGIDVNKAAFDGTTPLCVAAAKGRVAVVQAFLAADGIDVNKAKNDGTTPLCAATEEGSEQVFHALLAAPGIDVNKARTDGKTPLSVAVAKGYFAIANELVRKGATLHDVCQRDNALRNKTAIKAANHGCLELMQHLVQQCGLPVNDVKDEDGCSLLVITILNRSVFPTDVGHEKILKYFLSLKNSDGTALIDVDAVHPDCDATPLMYAAMIGEENMVESLLDANANLDVQDKCGRSALMHAVGRSKLEVVKTLLARHARTDLKNNNGQTVFDLIKHDSQDPKDQQIAALFRDHHETKIVQEVAVSGASVVLTGTATAGTAAAAKSA